MLLRERTGSNVQCVESAKINHGTEYAYRDYEIFLRLLFKPSNGTLWAFNRPQLDQQNFSEVPDPVSGCLRSNKIDESKQ